MTVTDDMIERAIAAMTAAENEPRLVNCTRCKGKCYHYGFGENGHDPDWCSECGGGGVTLAEGEERRPMRAALEAALSVPAQGAVKVACPCTTFEQDEDCPIGYPSLLCASCDGTGFAPLETVEALAAEMMKMAEETGEVEDPFAAWETISLWKSAYEKSTLHSPAHSGEREALERAARRLIDSDLAEQIRKLVAGWNGEGVPEEYRMGRHDDALGVTLPTNCGAIYMLDEVLSAFRAALEAKP